MGRRWEGDGEGGDGRGSRGREKEGREACDWRTYACIHSEKDDPILQLVRKQVECTSCSSFWMTKRLQNVLDLLNRTVDVVHNDEWLRRHVLLRQEGIGRHGAETRG